MGTHNWQYGRDISSRQTPLGHARGTGAAGHGTGDWLIHRVTAIAMIPLLPWFLYALFSGVAVDHASMQTWLGNPVNMTLMVVFIICAFWHGRIAFGVVVHDYVHTAWREFAIQTALKIGCFGLAAFAIVSVVLIGLGG